MNHRDHMGALARRPGTAPGSLGRNPQRELASDSRVRTRHYVVYRDIADDLVGSGQAIRGPAPIAHAPEVRLGATRRVDNTAVFGEVLHYA